MNIQFKNLKTILPASTGFWNDFAKGTATLPWNVCPGFQEN